MAPINKCNLVQHLIVLLLAVTAALAPGTGAAPAASARLADRQENLLDGPYQAQKEPASGRMYAVSKSTGAQVPLLPGLLDETLLNRGSFSFGAKQVAFHRLKVLGNIYVKNVNGRPLHEAYLFRSRLAAGPRRAGK